MNSDLGKIALQCLAAEKERRREYAEECAEHYRNGHTPHYCIHGMNLWVDYDPICGWCEDGDPGPYRMALDRAKVIHRQARELMEAASTVYKITGKGELFKTIINEATALLPK